jgi:hypothetical protein
MITLHSQTINALDCLCFNYRFMYIPSDKIVLFWQPFFSQIPMSSGLTVTERMDLILEHDGVKVYQHYMVETDKNFYEEIEQKMKELILGCSNVDASILDSSGLVQTNAMAYEWCEEQVKFIRSEVLKRGKSLSDAKASLWTYRLDGNQCLALDILINDNIFYSATLQANDGSYEKDLLTSDILVPDLAEALHLAGIILQSVGLRAEIGLVANKVNTKS